MSRFTRDEYLQKMRCRYRRYTAKPAKGEVVVDWVTPTAAMKGKKWDEVPKSLEIRESSTFQN